MSVRQGVGRGSSASVSPRELRAALACALLATATTTLASATASTPPCVVRLASTQPWSTSASTTTAVWELDVASTAGAPVRPPWALGVSALGVAVTGAWNLEAAVGAGNGSLAAADVVGHAPAYWQTLPAHGSGSARVGLVVEFEAGAPPSARLPASITLNGAPCSVVVAATDGEEGGSLSIAPDAVAAPPPPGMTTKDGEILGPDGKALFFTGVNWFGFEVGATAVDGLWGGTNAIAKDFPTVVWRLRLLGFNAVRLPFSFTDLWSLAPKPLASACAGVTVEAVVAATTAPPGAPAAGFATPPPLSTAPGPGPASLASQGMGGACNSDVPGPGSATTPTATTLDRFLWTAGYLAANGFYLLLDNQFNLDQTALRDPGLWVARWTELARRLVAEQPGAASVSMIDALNEPDAWGLAWEARAGKPGMTDLYLAVMDALDPVYPFLYVIEGCGQAGLAKNWGDGLATDPALIASRGLSDPNPFFKAVLGRPYVGRVVAGPHIYGPSVARTTAEMTGAGLYRRLSQSFGYLNKEGYCPGDGSGPCVRFPVFLGETGTGFLAWDDLQTQMDFAAYAMAGRPGGRPNPAADDGLHNPLSGVFWWCWNSNSEGAMGVVKSDWTAIDWNKVTWLEYVGLRPWWFGAGVATGPTQDGGGGGGAGSDGSDAPTVPALLRGRAPVARRGAAAAAANASSPAFSPGTFDGDLFGWGLQSGGLALGGSTGGGGGAPQPPPPPPPLPWVGPPRSAEAGAGMPPVTAHPLATAGSLILGAAGHPVDLRAVTWPAGFTNSASLGVLGTDSAAALARVGALGFNAIKLPLDLEFILKPGRAEPLFPAGPCPGTGAGVAALAAASLPPTVVRSAWTVFPSTAPLFANASSACNAYLPSTSTLDRLVGLVRLASASGLYVILEDAGGPASAGLAAPPPTWVGAWAAVAAAVAPAAGGKLAIRLAADPDVAGVGWVPGVKPPLGSSSDVAAASTTASHPGLGALLLSAMDALDLAAPGSLYLIPGAGQAVGMGGITGGGYSTAVGGGDEGSLAQAASAAAFFVTLANRPYARQAVVSPSWQVPSERGGGAGAPPRSPPVEWAALEVAWGGLTHTHPLLLGAFGGPPPPAQLVQATATAAEVEPVTMPTATNSSMSADAAALAALAAWLQPTCGLPACAAAAAVGGAAPGGGHVPVRSWAWDAWMVGKEEGGASTPSSSSSQAIVLAAAAPGGGGGGSDGSTPSITLPPVDWGVTAFLGGLGAVPWFAPPTPEWRGPPPPGPAPADAAGMEAATAPKGGAACAATFSISSPGLQHDRNGSSRAVGILSLTLAAAGETGLHSPLAPPYTLVVRPKAGGAYLGLRALAGATDGALSPGGAALTASVGDPWATLWASVSVAAVLEAAAGAGVSPVAALTPGYVAVGGRACRLAAAPAKPQAEGGGGGAPIPSLMQVVEVAPSRA